MNTLNVKRITAEQLSYTCPKCKGTTTGVDWCENPSCPNMPCCGKPRELCNCEETPKQQKP